MNIENPASTKATVARGFVTGMLAGPARAGRDTAQWLATVGIDLADSGGRFPLNRYAALYTLINRDMGDEAFGLFSQPLRLGAFEFLCRSLVSAPTLAEALQRAGRFLRMVQPDLAVGLEIGREEARLTIAEMRPLAAAADDPARVFAFEWLLRLLHGLSCWLVGRCLTLESVAFPYPPPPHAADYALIYTEHSEFGGERLTARLRPELMALPIRRDEAALAAFLEGGPGKLTLLYRRDREMALRVREILRAALPANLEEDVVAARLNVSARTLNRRLAQEGTSFRAIKASLRRDLALARLAQTRAPIAQVATELGYSDPSALYRAFVAWTGVSPEQYRKQLGNG